MYKPTPYPPGAELWLINLIDLKNRMEMTTKQIAEMENLAEKSVLNVFSGKSKSPSVNLIRRIIHALSGSWRETFDESGAVIGGQDLATLQAEVDRLTAENGSMSTELATLQAEVGRLIVENGSMSTELATLRDKVVNLTTENDILRMKLEHKEEIIAVHNYYIKRYPTE